MSHSHNHDSASKNIVTAFILNLVFAVVELVGGLLTNSVAILSDALHDFGDSVSLAVAWGLQRKSKQGRDAQFSYGYRRFSLLGSVFLSGVLLVSSIFIVSEAVERLLNPAEVHARGMLWLALAGILVNGLAILRLQRGKTLNERAVWLHLMEDVLGWIAVLVASVVMLLVRGAWVGLLDPILSLLITAWVLRGIWRNLRSTFRILLQGVPAEFDMEGLGADILGVEGVGSFHDLHVWSQDGTTHVMTVHIVLERGQDADIQRVKRAVRNVGRAHDADHVTVEVELPTDPPDCEYIGKCD